MSEARQDQTGDDPVRDGPCAKNFSLLKECAQRKGVRNEKQQLQACPSETDLLIRCVNKHPLYFQNLPKNR
jgi:hypothetical protein